jgi:thioredoxin reductase (NADPH)
VEGTATGGQAGATSRIENYLGFPSGISGMELAERSAIQADKFGGRITVPAAALDLRPHGGNHVVSLDDDTEITARAVVIATGVRYRRLPVPGIERYEGTCVYYAATAHEARACGTAPVSVVGGGNSAGQAAVFLARDSAQVYLLVRGGDLGDMSRYLVEQVANHPRIAVLTHTEVRDVVGEEDLRGIVVEDTAVGERRVLDTQVLFVFIGARPRTAWLAGAVALDRRGFVLTGPDADRDRDADVWAHVSRQPLALETSRPGVFAVGDVRRGSVKRVASAVGEGATAVRMVHDHLFEED